MGPEDVSGHDEKAEWYDGAIREGALAPFRKWIVPKRWIGGSRRAFSA